jgi:Ca-activated chloride channel family protein
MSFTSIWQLLTDVTFVWPLVALAWPIPLLLRKQLRANHSTRTNIAPSIPIYSQAVAAGVVRSSLQQNTSKITPIILLTIWTLLVISGMRPQFIGDQVDVPLTGRDIMLAIDISPSMQEEDMPLNGRAATRLDVVKSVVSDFIEQRESDRVGLILFGSAPYIQAPLSFDKQTVNTLLQEAFLGMAGQATAIGDAIALGVKRLRQRPAESRVLILLSDGANTAGEVPPLKAAQLAQQDSIKVYTVGIGAEEMLRRSFFGARRVNPSADLDETMLTDIATTTGGQYFRARNESDLLKIYEQINQLEPVERESRTYRPSKALEHYTLLSAFILYFMTLIFKTLVLPALNARNTSTSP